MVDFGDEEPNGSPEPIQNVSGVEGGPQEGEEEAADDDSVYMKDNVLLKKVQIEGEGVDYLMDPEGNIYDTDGQFIGTANPNAGGFEEGQEEEEGGAGDFVE